MQKRAWDLFDLFLFLYFFTLHADQLSFSLGGSTVRWNHLIGLACCLLFFFRFRLLSFSLPKDLLWALSFLTFSIVLSAVVSSYSQRCLLFLGWYGLILLTNVLFPFLLLQVMDFQKLMKLYFLSFLCVGLYALIQLFISDPFVEQRITHTIGRPNAFAYEPSFYALYMTPFVMIVTLRFLLMRDISLLYVLLVNGLFLSSTSTSAFIAYIVCFFLLLSLRRFLPEMKIWKFGKGLAFLSLGLALGVPALTRQFFFKFFTVEGLSHPSFVIRFTGIKNAWNIFLESPLLGVGLGGYPLALYEKWKSGDPKYLFVGEGDFPFFPQITKAFEPTNVLTEVLASLGLVGFLALSFCLVIYVRKAFQVLANPQVRQEEKQWTFLFLISTLTMLCVWQFNQGVLRTYTWTHISLTLAYFVRCPCLSSVYSVT